MGVLEEILEKLDSTESKKNTLRKSISSLVTDWREVEKDLELTQKSFQHYLSEHQNGEICLPDESYLAIKDKELKEREVSLNRLSEKLESDREELAVVENLVLGRLREVGLTEERLELRERRVEEREKAKLWVPLMEDREKALEMKGKEVALIREDLELKENDIEMLLTVCENREKELDKREGQLEDREKALEMKEKEVALLREDFELKERDIGMLSEKREKELDKREGQLELSKFVEELQCSLTSLEEELRAKRKYSAELEFSVTSLEEESGAKRMYFKELESSLKSLEKQLEVKRKYFVELESSVKSLEKGLEGMRNDSSVAEHGLMECQSKREFIEDGIMDFKRREMEELNVRKEQLELKEKQCKSEKELLEIGKKGLEQKMKGCKARRKASEIQKAEVRRRMLEVEVREKNLKAKEKELEEVTQLKQKQCESDNKALDLRMKEFEDRIKGFEIREKEFALKHKKVHVGISLEVELDGLDVHILLNDLKMDLSSPTEVSKALRLSGDPAFLVLSAMKVLYPPNLLKVDMRFEGSVGKSCILLLVQLIMISPTIQSQLREDALKLATEWKGKISSGNTLEVLAFLYFLASFDLASSFDMEEVMKLFESVSVAEHDQIPDLCHRLGLKDRMPGVQLDIKPSDIAGDKTEVEIKPPTFDIAPVTGAELFDSIVNMELNESQIRISLEHSSDGAELVLDALYNTNLSYSKEKKISVVKSVYYLLKQLASVSPYVKPSARKRALKFAIDWKLTLTDSNSWEVFAFLLFVGVYGLYPWAGAKYVLGLLEIHSQLVKETSGIIKILKWEHKAPGFIMSLIKNKQRLIAFDYVYEFNLVDKIPPVALLKKHVLDSKQATKKCKEGQTETQALDSAISDEISTLKDVIKCILDHSLELEYSPDMLRERVTCLEVERGNLKKCIPADITNSSKELNPVEKEQTRQEHTRKRPASAKDVQPSPSKKMCHKNGRFSNDRSSRSAHDQAAQQFVTEDGRGYQWPYSDNLVPIPPIFFQPYR